VNQIKGYTSLEKKKWRGNIAKEKGRRNRSFRSFRERRHGQGMQLVAGRILNVHYERTGSKNAGLIHGDNYRKKRKTEVKV